MKVNRYTIYVTEDFQEDFMAFINKNYVTGAVVDYDWEDSYESE